MTKILITLQRLAGGGGTARAAKRGILNRVMAKGSQTYEGTQDGLKERLKGGWGERSGQMKRSKDVCTDCAAKSSGCILSRAKRERIKLIIRALSNEPCLSK